RSIYQRPPSSILLPYTTLFRSHSFLAIDNAMIIGEREIHHRADFDLAVNDDRTILNLVHAENARLRRIQDRRGHERDRNPPDDRSEEHTSELQSRENLVCRLLL